MEEGLAYLKYKSLGEAELRVTLVQRDQELDKKSKAIEALETELSFLKKQAAIQESNLKSLSSAFKSKEDELRGKNRQLEAYAQTLKEDLDRVVRATQQMRQAKEKETLSLSEASESYDRGNDLLKNFSERIRTLRESSRSPPRATK